MSQYRKTTNHVGGEQFVAQTRARLETIRTHLEVAPRTGKLKGKTCVITGAGSLKGIGSVGPFNGYALYVPHVLFIGEPARCSSPMRVGAISLFVDPADSG